MKRKFLIGASFSALVLAAMAPWSASQANGVSVRVSTPEFGIRIGAPHFPHPVFQPVPVYRPVPVYPARAGLLPAPVSVCTARSDLHAAAALGLRLRWVSWPRSVPLAAPPRHDHGHGHDRHGHDRQTRSTRPSVARWPALCLNPRDHSRGASMRIEGQSSNVEDRRGQSFGGRGLIGGGIGTLVLVVVGLVFWH